MKTIEEKIKSYDDAFRKAKEKVKKEVINSESYEKFWELISDDKEYLSFATEVEEDFKQRKSFVISYVAGIILLNAKADSEEFIRVQYAITTSVKRVMELGLRNFFENSPYTLIELLLRRDDAVFAEAEKRNILNFTDFIPSVEVYQLSVSKLTAIIRENNLDETWKLSKDGEHKLADELANRSYNNIYNSKYCTLDNYEIYLPHKYMKYLHI